MLLPSKPAFYLAQRLTSCCSVHSFVPKHNPVPVDDIEALHHFIKTRKKVLVLTGAGISTESGIPDYRSEGVGLYARSNHRPVQYRDYLYSPSIRQRYWARNYAGWSKFSQSQPNPAHYALRRLELQEKLSCIVTQNVDGLHTKAGSSKVIELHGTAFRVVCLDCDASYDRDFVQSELAVLNHDFTESADSVRPDGDVEISAEKVESFRSPSCGGCGGMLKPDIIFFGDNVPRERVEAVRDEVKKSDGVLVLGSSLTVFSGYRVVLQAREAGKGVAIVNIGPTRGDHLSVLKISGRCGDVLTQIA